MNTNTSRETFSVSPVGYIESEYKHFDEVPHPHGKNGWNEDNSTIVLYPEHAKEISGLDGYSHIIVLFWIDRSGEWKMPEHHHKHHKPDHVKVFATRMPVRPNPIGLSVVEVQEISYDGGRILIRGLDALDRTPVLDIKPYIPDFDSYPEARLPEWVGGHLKEHDHQH